MSYPMPAAYVAVDGLATDIAGFHGVRLSDMRLGAPSATGPSSPLKFSQNERLSL